MEKLGHQLAVLTACQVNNGIEVQCPQLHSELLCSQGTVTRLPSRLADHGQLQFRQEVWMAKLPLITVLCSWPYLSLKYPVLNPNLCCIKERPNESFTSAHASKVLTQDNEDTRVAITFYTTIHYIEYTALKYSTACWETPLSVTLNCTMQVPKMDSRTVWWMCFSSPTVLHQLKWPQEEWSDKDVKETIVMHHEWQGRGDRRIKFPWEPRMP